MGSKFTTTAISGFNSSPPSDDGSVSASNQLQWSKHLDKIGTPLKNLAESINTKLVAFTDFGSRSVTVSDSTVASDHMKTVEIASTATTGVTISLGDAASMTAGYIVRVKNLSVYTQAIGRVTSADGIDGTAANIAIAPKAAITFCVLATASSGYMTLNRSGPFVDSDALVVGGADGSKKVRIEADGLTTGTTRVATMPDKDITLAGLVDFTGANGAGLVLIQSQTLSGVASVVFSTGIDSTYDDYEVHLIDFVPASNGTGLRLQVSEDGGSTFKTTSGDYTVATHRVDSGSAHAVSGGADTGIIIVDTTNGQSTEASNSLQARVKFINPAGTAKRKRFITEANYLEGTGTAHTWFSTIGVYVLSNNAINAFRILYGTGNISSGIARLYGVRKT